MKRRRSVRTSVIGAMAALTLTSQLWHIEDEAKDRAHSIPRASAGLQAPEKICDAIDDPLRLSATDIDPNRALADNAVHIRAAVQEPVVVNLPTPSENVQTRGQLLVTSADLGRQEKSDGGCGSLPLAGAGFEPSDGGLAVSANFFVAAVNGRIVYGPKNSAPTTSLSPYDFFTRSGVVNNNSPFSPNGQTNFYDPRVIWTKQGGGNGRFIVSYGGPGGNVYFAVTRAETPSMTSGWRYYRVAFPGDKWDINATRDKFVIKNQIDVGVAFELFGLQALIDGTVPNELSTLAINGSSRQRITMTCHTSPQQCLKIRPRWTILMHTSSRPLARRSRSIG